MAKGELFIVSAPSGAGKTSLVDALVSENRRLCVSVSYTTRRKRPKEQDGINYHFIEKARFLSMLEAGTFWRSAEVYGHHYGTSKKWVAQQLEEGLSVILEIDWQGRLRSGRSFRKAATFSSYRHHSRRSPTDCATAHKTMTPSLPGVWKARDVMQHVTDADFLVVNEDFATALEEMRAIIQAWSLRVETREARLRPLLASLTEG